MNANNKQIGVPDPIPLPMQLSSVYYPYLETLKPTVVANPATVPVDTSASTIGQVLKTLFKFRDLKQCKSSNTSTAYYMSVKDLRTTISKNDLLKQNIPTYSSMKKEDICKRLIELKSLT
jgi:hypothetical protein